MRLLGNMTEPRGFPTFQRTQYTLRRSIAARPPVDAEAHRKRPQTACHNAPRPYVHAASHPSNRCMPGVGSSGTNTHYYAKSYFQYSMLLLLYCCCCRCCSHINSHNQVLGHRTGSSHSGAEEYPMEKHTQTNPIDYVCGMLPSLGLISWLDFMKNKI